MSILIRGSNSIVNNDNKDTAIYRNSNTRIYSLEKDTEVYTKYMEVYNDNGSFTKSSTVEHKYKITANGDYYIPGIYTIMKGNKVIDIETTANRPILDDVVLGSYEYITKKYTYDAMIEYYTPAYGFEYKGRYYMLCRSGSSSHSDRLVIINSSNEIVDIKNLTIDPLGITTGITGIVLLNDTIYIFDRIRSFILDIENLTITYHSDLPHTYENIRSVFTFNNEIYAIVYYTSYGTYHIHKIDDSISTYTVVCDINYNINIIEHNGFAYYRLGSTDSDGNICRDIYKSSDLITFTLVSTISPSFNNPALISLHGVLYFFTIDRSDNYNYFFYTISDDGTATMILNDYKKHFHLYSPNISFTYNDSIYTFYYNGSYSTTLYSFSVYSFGVDGYFKKGWKINDIKITEDGFHHLDIDKNIVTIEP